MRSVPALVAIWVCMVAFSIACWLGLFWLGAHLIAAWQEYVAVKVAVAVLGFGAGAFMVGEQWRELRERAEDR